MQWHLNNFTEQGKSKGKGQGTEKGKAKERYMQRQS
jgi:hypothetical protein